jgi:hypothetical protein
MVTPSKVFADTPVLNAIPDIPHYYKTIAGFSFIIDLTLLSIMMAQMLTFAGQKARLPKKMGAIIGIVFGASLTFAIHGAGYTLLQHWLVWLFMALEVGAAMYFRNSARFGKGAALLIGFLSTMAILAIGRAATAGEYAQGAVNLGVWILAIIGLFAIWSNIRRGGAEGGGGGGGGGRGGPDEETVLRLAALEGAIGQHDQRLGLMDRTIQDIRGLIEDILRRLREVEEFISSWRNWFTNELTQGLNNLQTQITTSQQVTQQQIAALQAWSGEVTTFQQNTDRALLEMNARLNEGKTKLEGFAGDLRSLRADHAALSARVDGLHTAHNSLSQRVAQLPAEIQQQLKPELDSIRAKITELEGKLAQVAAIESRVRSLEDITSKLDIPTLTNLKQELDRVRGEMNTSIADLQKKIADLAKNKPGRKSPKEVEAARKGCVDAKGANSGVIANLNIIDSKIRDISGFGPQLAEFLKGFATLSDARKHTQDADGIKETLKKLLKDCNAKVGQAEEKERKKKGAKKTGAALEEVTLDSIQQNVNEQYRLLMDVRKKLEAVIHNLDVKVLRKTDDEKRDKARWQVQIKSALDMAVTETKRELKTEIDIEKLKAKECIEKLHQAVQEAERFASTDPAETKRTAEFVQHIRNIEAREAHVLEFVDRFEETLVAQVIAVASADPSSVPSGSGSVQRALAPYLESLDKVLKELEVIQTVVLAAKRTRRTPAGPEGGQVSWPGRKT